MLRTTWPASSFLLFLSCWFACVLPNGRGQSRVRIERILVFVNCQPGAMVHRARSPQRLRALASRTGTSRITAAEMPP